MLMPVGKPLATVQQAVHHLKECTVCSSAKFMTDVKCPACMTPQELVTKCDYSADMMLSHAQVKLIHGGTLVPD
jgi:hypothetical protein